MITELDFNSSSARLVLCQRDIDHLPSLVLYNLHTNSVGVAVDQSFVPLGPRLCHDGQRLAFFDGNGRLFVHHVESSETRYVLDDVGLHAGFCEWSPDDEQLVFSAYPLEGYRVKPGLGPDIYTLHLTSGEFTQLTDDFFVNRFPKWSPSGRHIVFQRQDLSARRADIQVCVVEVATSRFASVPAAPGSECVADRYAWSPDGTHLLITEISDAARLRLIRLTDMSGVWGFEWCGLESGAFAPDGTVLVVCDDRVERLACRGGQVLESLSLSELGPLGDSLSLRRVGFDEQHQAVLLATKAGKVYMWRDGKCVLLLDNGMEPTLEIQEDSYLIASRDGRQTVVRRSCPAEPKQVTVMLVHGGPPGVGDANSASADDPVAQRLLREGYEIICPAYRGMDENEGEYGRTDVWDVLDAANDWKQRFGEGRPLALIGYSYGGYLTYLALAQPGAPWSCGITLWGATHPFGLHAAGWFPTDPHEKAIALVARSPMEQASNIQMPLLILAGGRDFVSPEVDVTCIRDRVSSQGVPCELTVYPDDTHGLPRYRQEVYHRILDFLARFG